MVAFERSVASFVTLLLPVGKALTGPLPADTSLLLIKTKILHKAGVVFSKQTAF